MFARRHSGFRQSSLAYSPPGAQRPGDLHARTRTLLGLAFLAAISIIAIIIGVANVPYP